MNRKKDKGRLPDFIPLIKSTWKSPSCRAMSHGARSLYVSLKARYNTRLQNGVYMSARMGAEELGSSKDYVARWHHELQHYGFIRVIEGKGSAAWFRRRRNGRTCSFDRTLVRGRAPDA